MHLTSVIQPVLQSNLCNMTDRELAASLQFQKYPDYLVNLTTICCTVFITFGIPGNLLTIIALARYEKVRNATAISIMNLSFSDLLFCCVNLPLVVSTFFNRYWTHGYFLCRIFAYARYSLGGVSLLTVLVITINRYIMILHPKLYPKLYRRRYLILMLASTWIFPFGIMILPWFGKWGRYGPGVLFGSCNILPDSNGISLQKFVIPIAFSMPMLAIIICYAHIYYVVRKATRASGATVSHKTMNLKQAVSLPLTVRQIKSNKISASWVKPNERDDNLVASNQISLGVDINTSPSLRRNVVKKSMALVKISRPTRKDRRLGSMIIAIVISFCTCHLPIAVSKMLHNYRSHPIPNLVGYILLILSTCINPVIYVFMSSNYRKAYKNLFKCRN